MLEDRGVLNISRHLFTEIIRGALEAWYSSQAKMPTRFCTWPAERLTPQTERLAECT